MAISSVPSPSQPSVSYSSSDFGTQTKQTSEIHKIENVLNNGIDNYAGSRSLGQDTDRTASASTALPSNMQVLEAPASSALATALATMRTDDQNPANRSQTTRLSDGRTLAMRSTQDGTQFAIFNPDGSQQAPNPSTGAWQTINPNINGGKGTLDLGNGQMMNFDLNGYTVDPNVKNKGTPLTIDSSGNITGGPTGVSPAPQVPVV